MYNFKNIIHSILTIFFIIALSSCKLDHNKSNLSKDKEHHLNINESYDTLYYQCDSIITIDETRKIYNSFYDTIVIESGIFSFLTYNYEQGYCQDAIALTRTALEYETIGQTKKAKEKYQQIIEHYIAEQTSDTERIDFSDCDLFTEYKINSALLCSNAYYKIGDIDKAIEILSPAISYNQNSFCRIHFKYIQLCIIKYGKKKVAQEINNCAKTILYKKENSCNNGWIITIFGTDMSLNGDKLYKDSNLTPNKVTELLKHEEFSRLIQ